MIVKMLDDSQGPVSLHLVTPILHPYRLSSLGGIVNEKSTKWKQETWSNVHKSNVNWIKKISSFSLKHSRYSRDCSPDGKFR